MQLHKEVVTEKTWNLLQKVQTSPGFKSFYLVGGTALALQLGHRISNDLDLFCSKEFKTNITKQLDFKYRVVSLHNNSIELFVENTKFFFFYFTFPRVHKIIKKEGVKLADPIDIGLMKLLALQGRTSKKDIVDLYFIDQKVMPLAKLLDHFERKYPKESFSSYDSFKSFFNIDKVEPMPKLLIKVHWDECLELVENKITEHLKKLFSKKIT